MRSVTVQPIDFKTRYAITIAILTLTCAHGALAQVQRSGGGANAQLAQQYQQIVTERSQLQADHDKLKKELDDTKKQLESAKRELAASKAATGTAASQLAFAQSAGQTTSQTLEQTKTRLQELVSRFRDTAVTLRGVESERAQLQQQLAQSKEAFDRCAERNYQLYQVDNAVLERYEHQGVFSRLAQAEPFTRIKRTQIENFVDEYRTRAEELRVQKTPSTPVGPKPAAPAVPFAAPAAPAAPVAPSAPVPAPAGNAAPSN
jgi:chromosome segregation ATPase